MDKKPVTRAEAEKIELKQIKDADRDADAYHVTLIRRYAQEVTGGTCAFADDDLHMLASLAYRAGKAGLTEGMNKQVRANIAAVHAK